MTPQSVRWLAYATIATLLALGHWTLQRDPPTARVVAGAWPAPRTRVTPAPATQQTQTRRIAARARGNRSFTLTAYRRGDLSAQPVSRNPKGLECLPELVTLRLARPGWPGRSVQLAWRLRATRPETFAPETKIVIPCGCR